MLGEEWDPDLCKSPEYQLLLAGPPAFYRKRDRDTWYRSLKGLSSHGVLLWD